MFYFSELLTFDSLEMREVKAQAIGFDQRAGLSNVISENIPQGPMKDMRGSVMALNGHSSAQIDVKHGTLFGDNWTLGPGLERM